MATTNSHILCLSVKYYTHILKDNIHSIFFQLQHADVSSDIKDPLLSLQLWTGEILFIPLHRHPTCSYMKRGEKPEGYRQRRPKTFPVTNYSGNSQQMLQEIRNSLRNLSKPSDPPKVDTGAQGKMLPEDSRQLGRSNNPKNPHHKTLQEIREALMPFKHEPNTSGLQREPRFAGLEEVRNVFRYR